MRYAVYELPKKLSLQQFNDIAMFAMEELGLLDLPGYISFEFRDNDEMEAAYGYVHGCLKDKEYEVELNCDSPVFEITSTIFHELVHVKQIAEGRYVQGNLRKKNRWLGKIWRDTDPTKFPWELEAYDMEEALYEKWRSNYEHFRPL